MFKQTKTNKKHSHTWKSICSDPLSIILFGFFGVLLFSCMNSSYILSINPLLEMLFAIAVWLVAILLIVSFAF